MGRSKRGRVKDMGSQKPGCRGQWGASDEHMKYVRMLDLMYPIAWTLSHEIYPMYHIPCIPHHTDASHLVDRSCLDCIQVDSCTEGLEEIGTPDTAMHSGRGRARMLHETIGFTEGGSWHQCFMTL